MFKMFSDGVWAFIAFSSNFFFKQLFDVNLVKVYDDFHIL